MMIRSSERWQGLPNISKVAPHQIVLIFKDAVCEIWPPVE